MICGQLKELLMQVALDEASAEERARVEAHMAGCAACRQVFAEWKLTRKLVARALPQEEPPQRICFAPARRSGWAWQRAFTIPVGAAAAIAILITALALSGARLSVTEGRWEVAFGRPAAALTPATSGINSATGAQLFTREQMADLVAAAVRDSEQRQRADTVQFVRKAIGDVDRRQQTALHDVGMQMSYFERAQNIFYKQNEGTLYALQNLEKRLPGAREGRP